MLFYLFPVSPLFPAGSESLLQVSMTLSDKARKHHVVTCRLDAWHSCEFHLSPPLSPSLWNTHRRTQSTAPFDQTLTSSMNHHNIFWVLSSLFADDSARIPKISGAANILNVCFSGLQVSAKTLSSENQHFVMSRRALTTFWYCSQPVPFQTEFF